jgi:hypothetical protein
MTLRPLRYSALGAPWGTHPATTTGLPAAWPAEISFLEQGLMTQSAEIVLNFNFKKPLIKWLVCVSIINNFLIITTRVVNYK